MTPPINIDGTQITGASIDGTEVQAITVDGTEVFASSSVGDISMLQSPEVHYDASLSSLSDGSTGPFKEDLIGSDIPARNDPEFQSNLKSTAVPGFSYDNDSTPDDHDGPTNSGIFDDNTDISIITVHNADNYTNSGNVRAAIATVCDEEIRVELKSDGSGGFVYNTTCNNANNIDGGGTASVNQLDTMMVTYSTSGNAEVYGGGGSSPVQTGSSNPPTSLDRLRISPRGVQKDGYTGGVYEVIISSSIESGSDYATLHNDRVS